MQSLSRWTTREVRRVFFKFQPFCRGCGGSPSPPPPFYLFVLKFIYLYLAVLGLRCCFSLVVASGAALSLWCEGFSLPWLLLFPSMGSRQADFCSCGARTPLLCGVWEPPGPGIARRTLIRCTTREVPGSYHFNTFSAFGHGGT